MQKFDTIIIGGGASGLATAVSLSGSVAIFEANERVGKKLLATGNGKCNLLNNNLNLEKYNDKAFVSSVFKKYDKEAIVSFFDKLGLVTRTDGEGRVYPMSETASSVLDVLRRRVAAKGIAVFPSSEIVKLSFSNGYVIHTADTSAAARHIIFAAGSNAGFGLDSLKLLSPYCNCTPFSPSLAPLLTETKSIKGLSGVRVKCVASLLSNGVSLCDEEGEILFKDNGLSGIAAFNLSGAYARAKAPADVSLNFLPKSIPDVDVFLSARLAALGDVDFETFLTGILQKMLAKSVTEYAGFKLTDMVTADKLNKLKKALIGFSVKVLSVANASAAQVMTGGVKTSCLTDSLEVKGQKGLFVVGEAVDVDGLCGGYNLAWAWASANVAAAEINGRLLPIQA